MPLPYILIEKSVVRKPNSTKTIQEVLDEAYDWMQELQDATSLDNKFFFAEVIDSETLLKYSVYSNEATDYFDLESRVIELGGNGTVSKGTEVVIFGGFTQEESNQGKNQLTQFESEIDTHNAYDNGLYTIPVDGIYEISFSAVAWDDLTTGVLQINDITKMHLYHNMSDGERSNIGIMRILKCVKGDIIKQKQEGIYEDRGYTNYNALSIKKIG